MGAREILHSSESNEWYTPAWFIDAVHRVMGGVDLDPASCLEANGTIRALNYFTIDDDGLSKPWYGRVFLNPPYGKSGGVSNQALWTVKLLDEYHSGRVAEAILLVNAATGAVWFRPLFNFTLCFITPRIRFGGQNKNSPTHYSAAVYFGPNTDSFQETFSEFGAVVARRRPGARAVVIRPRRHGKSAEISGWLASGENTIDHQKEDE